MAPGAPDPQDAAGAPYEGEAARVGQTRDRSADSPDEHGARTTRGNGNLATATETVQLSRPSEAQEAVRRGWRHQGRAP